MADWVTPNEMAAELGVDSKRLRRWLRQKKRRGDRRLGWHIDRQAWRIDPGLAWDLNREFAIEVLGAVEEDVRGPHAWLNWHAYTAGRPRRSSPRTSTSLVLPNWLEYGLYSDVPVRGSLTVGPYRFINTIAREHPAGDAALRVVLRADDHLAEPITRLPSTKETTPSMGRAGWTTRWPRSSRSP